MDKKEYSIDDLPLYSNWPAKLLGLEPCPMRKKTSKQVSREFEEEKWGALLKWVKSQNRPLSISELNEYHFLGSNNTLCYEDGKFKPSTIEQSQSKYISIIEDTIKNYLPASAIVEFGAGYGNIILNLIERKYFGDIKFIAGELTNSGKEIIDLLHNNKHINLDVGICDFSKPSLTELTIPENAIIFTSYACHYIPKYQPSFIEAFRQFKPRVVIHLEPFYEHCDDSTLLGLMRRRYIEVNDYNTNLLSILKDQEVNGIIKIVQEKPNDYGFHPLLVNSICAWNFVG
jgi:hypothetical protein